MRGKGTFLFQMEGSFSIRLSTVICWQISGYIWYVFLELHFIVDCNSEHFEIFSNRNSRVFAIELRHGLCLSITMP